MSKDNRFKKLAKYFRPILMYVFVLIMAVFLGYKGVLGYSIVGFRQKGADNSALTAAQKVLDDSHDLLASTGVIPYAADQIASLSLALFLIMLCANILALSNINESKLQTVILPRINLVLLGVLTSGLLLVIFWATTNFPYSNYQPTSANSKYGIVIAVMVFLTVIWGLFTIALRGNTTSSIADDFSKRFKKAK